MSRDTPIPRVDSKIKLKKPLTATESRARDKLKTLSIPARSQKEGKAAVEHVRKFLGKYLAEASELELDNLTSFLIKRKKKNLKKEDQKPPAEGNVSGKRQTERQKRRRSPSRPRTGPKIDRKISLGDIDDA